MSSLLLERFQHIGCYAVVLGGVVLSLSGCGKEDAAGAGGPQRGARLVPVRVAAVVERSLAPRVTVVGTVTPKRVSAIASGADGIVQSYDVEAGSWVKKGTVLSQLRMESSNRTLAQAEQLLEQYRQEWEETKSFRAEEIAQAKFRMEAARTLRDVGRKKYAREQRAFKNGAVNEDQLDTARERADQTEALYQAAQQNHKLMVKGPRKEKRLQAERKMKAQQERVGFLKAENAKRTTKAPIAGFVVKEHSFVGQWLSKGDPVATIAMLDEVDVIVIVDEADIRHVRIGEKTAVRIPGSFRVWIRTQTDLRRSAALGATFAVTDGGAGFPVDRREQIELIGPQNRVTRIERAEVTSTMQLPWLGRIVQIVPKSDWETGSRGFPVKVRIKNRFRFVTTPPANKGAKPGQRRLPVLKEGLMASVTFEGTAVMKFLVPKDALVRSTQGLKVHVFTAAKGDPSKGSTMQMGVKTGQATGDLIEIIPQPSNAGEPAALTKGMLIVTEGGENLRPVQGDVVIKEKPIAKRE